MPIKNYYAPELHSYLDGLMMSRYLLSLFIGSTIMGGFLLYLLIVKLLKWKKQKKLNRFTKNYTRRYQYMIGGLLAGFLIMNLVTSILSFIFVVKEFKADLYLKDIIIRDMQLYESELNRLEQTMRQTCTSNPRLNEFHIQISECQTEPTPKFFDESIQNNMVNIVKESQQIQNNHNWQVGSFITEVILFIFILLSLGWMSYAVRKKLQYQFQLSSYIYCFIAGISFITIYLYSISTQKRLDICGHAMKQIGNNNYIISEGFFHYIPLYTTFTKVQLRRNQQYNYELTRFNIDNYLQNVNQLVNQYNLSQFKPLLSKSGSVQQIIKHSADQVYHQNQYGEAQTNVNQNINILKAIKLNNDAQNNFKVLLQHVPVQQLFVDIEKDYCITSAEVQKLSPSYTTLLRSFSLLGISILSQSVVNILTVKKLQKYKKQQISSVRKQLL